ncbi:TIGR04283 family arsenosugar biosynthesis glycosyltransferase [Vulcanococcus sp.]|jgi:rSAM/selenodomain-associated transferase 2|uniref:TIGR04283 family arsenosugar biosynthesis glycosyltransferase n=1 Tax=Vulcanococcus sp. TaxID=2856995 RepID=UPI003BFDF42E
MKAPALAVVIPARSESTRLPLLLADLAGAPAAWSLELTVVDGGSRDGTARIARLAGARLIASEPSRGRQLALGIAATTAPWLLLLHADARLQPGWSAALERAMAQPEAAWAFDLQVEGTGLGLRLLEQAVRLRSQLRQLPYGDQGLLLPRSLLERAGGMPEIPLMEDLLLIQRLQPLAAIRRLGCPLRVHGRRWQRHGVLGTAWRNAALRRAWRQGLSAEQLAQRYYG